MSTEEIIRAWKSEDDEEKNEQAPVNPAGEELSDEELNDVEGGSELIDIIGDSGQVGCSCQKFSC